MGLEEQRRRLKAIASDSDGRERLMRDEKRLVAHFVRGRIGCHKAHPLVVAAEAAGDDARVPAAHAKRLDERDRHGRLACAADVDVAHHHHGNREPVRHRAAALLGGSGPVEEAERVEQARHDAALRPLAMYPGFKLGGEDHGSISAADASSAPLGRAQRTAF